MNFNQSHGIVMVSLLGDIYELFLIFSTFYLNATKNTQGRSFCVFDTKGRPRVFLNP